MTRRVVLVVICLGIAGGWLVQPLGDNQSAHYITIQSIAAGKKNVDALAPSSHDLAWTGGHYHAAKSPGLDLLLAPAARALEATGFTFHNVAAPKRLTPAGRPAARDLLPLTLLGSLLPALALLVLVALEAERLRPGSGQIAAVILGTGTLVFPFSTLLFSHVLSTLLGFAGLTVLLRARAAGADSRWLYLAAGLLLGFATVVEYPVGIFVLMALAYVGRGAKRRLHLPPLAAGLAVGVSPLPLYTWWAYGSPLASTYAGAIKIPGRSGHDVLGENDAGFFGITRPHVHALIELLVGGRGLFVVTPVVAVGLVGLVQLLRRGERAYALTGLATFGLFLLYDCSYWTPFGGGTPGPRFLIPTLPFLAIGVATAWASLKNVAIPLLLASAVTMAVATTTAPVFTAPTTSIWWHLARTRHFLPTIGPGGIAVVFGALACALLTLVPRRPRLDLEGLLVSAFVLGAWFAAFALGPPLFGNDLADHATGGAYVAGAIGVAAALGAAAAARKQFAAAAAILTPLWLGLLPGLRAQTRLDATLAAGSLLVAIVLPLVRAKPWLPLLRTAEHAPS